MAKSVNKELWTSNVSSNLNSVTGLDAQLINENLFLIGLQQLQSAIQIQKPAELKQHLWLQVTTLI